MSPPPRLSFFFAACLVALLCTPSAHLASIPIHASSASWPYVSLTSTSASSAQYFVPPPTYTKYLVTFKKHFNPHLQGHQHVQNLLQLYASTNLAFIANAQGEPALESWEVNEGLKGYIATMHKDVAEKLRDLDEVDHVEEDQVVHTYEIQMDAPWGLARISHRDLPTPSHGWDYHYNPSGGKNVSVYVIDTGINIRHQDFGGRAVWGKTIPPNEEDEDGNGHGTHCAGIVGGKTYGVAKHVTLVAVKVLASNGAGSMSDVLKGVEWAVKDHRAREAKHGKSTRSVANMSLGGGYSKTLNRAVDAAVEAGMHFAVAAGNDDSNACAYSPASAKKALTVGASTDHDDMARFSNHGRCVDVFAPGKDIESAWTGSSTATRTISGTSMASPHGAGAMAYLLSIEDPALATLTTPKLMKKALLKLATPDHLHGLPGKDNEGGNPRQPPFPFPFPPGDDDGDDDEGETKNRLLFIGKFAKDRDTPLPEPSPVGGDAPRGFHWGTTARKVRHGLGHSASGSEQMVIA